MISEEAIDKVIERLGTRIEAGNERILKKIGESVKKIGTLTPSQARQLGQMLKYGSDFDEITQELEDITGRNVSDIYDIYEEVAKNDYNFARQFYDYRNTKYIPYEENYALQNQIMAIASITASEYMNISRTTSLGYGTFDELGNVTYKGVRDVYYDLIDEAILNVAQGKESFDEAMYRQLKTIGESGLRVIYPSTYETTDEFGNPIIKNRSMRLDSAIRMNMKQGLTDMHNETQKQFGQEFGADGVEISVHGNPAPDHAEAQGRQFSNAEFEKLQTTGNAKDYKGKAISIYGTLKSGAPTKSFRPIGMYNCYHYNFSIVLGVNEPSYSDEQLQGIIDSNNQGFDLDGEHYTNYQGTQLQRNLERRIRELKDTQILAKASDNKKLIAESQEQISLLTDKYRELSQVSGLPTKMERMRVSGYRRTKVDVEKPKVYKKYDDDETRFIKDNPGISLKQRNTIIDEWTSDAGGYHSNSGLVKYMIEDRERYPHEGFEQGIKELDAQIKGRLSENITTYRTIQIPAKDLKVGMDVDDKTFIATSISKYDSAAAFNKGDAFSSTIEIDVDKGMRALYIGDKTGHGRNEKELLFPEEYKIKITSIEKQFDADGDYMNTLIKGKMMKK